MKIILVNPLQENPCMPGPPKLILNEGGVFPPQGLLYLATYLKKFSRHEVKILDCIAEALDYAGVETRLAQEKPDVVGVTLTTLYLGDGYRILQIVKKISKDIITIAGGPHPTLFPKQTIKLPEVDYAVCGEADYILGEMLDRIETKKPLDDMEGVLSKTSPNKEVKQLFIDKLDDLPLVDYTLLPYNKYHSILSTNNPVTVMMTSRGCPFKCAYCPQAGTKIRKRNAKIVADEIEQYIKLGIKDILFFDELFTLEHERVKELCDEFLRRNLKFRFHIRTRIRDVNKDIIKLLKKSGCRLIQFGVESGTARIQKLMNKNLDLDKVRQVIKMTRQEGILTYGNFMLGSPTETKEEMQATIDFAKSSRLDFAVFAITLLLPKTEYYNQAAAQGKIKEDFWEKYILNPLVPIDNAYWPDFTKEFLEEMCKKGYNEFYFRPWYIWNYLTRILSPAQLTTHAKAAFHVLKSFSLSKLTGK
ncbi:MAG: hypothetical protein A2252_08715 [Elusimicrobia bacterium RIFOXYA2_FULL_39_19]|nr:MAG: hypothetical protein A2252_08715 [Elusimicrobia bacterium RIFOXYA2_FULL_39_19]